MKNYIGVFDSGKGGLSILKQLKKVLPNYNFIYYSDKKNNPYGEKSPKELLNITKKIVERLKQEGCKIIVIACNTATTRCIKQLKDTYQDLIFIGTVPAIKVASDHNYKNTLVMATPATITSQRTTELINDNQKEGQNIFLEACPGLASAIENDNYKTIENILNSLSNKYKNIDSLVLGCTHYSLIKNEIQKYFPKVVLLDGSIGVANEVKRQVEINNLKSDNTGSIRIIKN